MNPRRCEIHYEPSEENEGRYSVIRIEGHLDTRSVGEFELIAERVFAAGPARLVIDLEDTDRISSAGMGALVGLQKKLTENRGAMVLLSPGPNVTEALRVLGLTDEFLIAQTSAEVADLMPPA